MAEEERERAILLRVVLDHMLHTIRDAHPKPLIWKELQARLPQEPRQWDQTKISRTMADLLGAPNANGMTAYKELFGDSKLRAGFLTRNIAGDLTPDRAVTQPPPEI